ncbi:MAG: winged helix-turn-helix transcriptional regulator [Burkholderiaceae bacterium]|nr:winged helix-turn-helix transcriptional regulator [Burkholderiaceae bacterium]
MLNQSASLDQLFRMLADPTRRAILDRLSRSEASVGDLAKPLNISLAAVVQHVQALEESGMIRTHKVGRVRTCRIESAALGQVEQWLAERRTMWERHFDLLGAVLAKQAPEAGKDEP